MKNFFCELIKSATRKSTCVSDESMLKEEVTFEDELDFMKNLLSQPLSEEIKDRLIKCIGNLNFAFRSLREENTRLKRDLRSRTHTKFCRSSLTEDSSHLDPVWVQLERERSRASPSFSRVGGMVDILKVSSPCRKQRPAPLASPRLTAIQPSGPRKPEPLRTRNNTPREPPKEVKFSKYSPLPSIKGKIRPKLLRERTYDVIEPIFVKGPPKEDKGTPSEVKKPLLKDQPNPTPLSTSQSRITFKGSQLASLKKVKSLPPPDRSDFVQNRQTFDPSNVAPPSDIPSNVFWFPM